MRRWQDVEFGFENSQTASRLPGPPRPSKNGATVAVLRPSPRAVAPASKLRAIEPKWGGWKLAVAWGGSWTIAVLGLWGLYLLLIACGASQ